MTDLPSVEECNKAMSDHEYYLGSGKDRHAYHIPGSRWVYKVDRRKGNYTNRREIERYQYVMENQDRIPEGVFIPEMHMLDNGVIASEFVGGRRPTSFSEKELVYEFNEEFDCFDSSAECNIRIVSDNQGNKRVYVIDLGE